VFVCRKLESGDECCRGNSSISIFADSDPRGGLITSDEPEGHRTDEVNFGQREGLKADGDDRVS
jgi:hypothetical protein